MEHVLGMRAMSAIETDIEYHMHQNYIRMGPVINVKHADKDHSIICKELQSIGNLQFRYYRGLDSYVLYDMNSAYLFDVEDVANIICVPDVEDLPVEFRQKHRKCIEKLEIKGFKCTVDYAVIFCDNY